MCLKIKSQLLLAFFVCLISLPSLPASANEQELSQFDKSFIALLHAKKTNGSYRTPFKHRKLFSNNSDIFDLYSEIDATKKHIIDKETPNFECKYPALYNLFSEKYPAIEKTNYSKCKFFPVLNNLKKIRVSFASGYLGNPASFFGHLYITPIHSEKNYENYAYNIGAITPNGENPLLYVIRGLIGSYDTSYKKIPYLVQTNKYLRQEGRDIYEFDLKLTAAENKILLLHLIEMEGENTSYYFANKNCAYELAQILNVVGSLNEDNEKIFYYPIHLLLSIKNKGKIGDIIFRASNKTEFHNFYSNRNDNEKLLFEKELSSVLEGKDIDSMFSQSILNFGYAFVEDEKTLRNIKINRINNHSSTTSYAKEMNLFSRSPIKLNFGIGKIDNLDTLKLKFKPAFYDFVDYPSNVFPGNKITFLESVITLSEAGLGLNEIVFIDIHKGELKQSNLIYDNQYEWGVSAKYKKIMANNFYTLNGYMGKNYFESKNFAIQYGLAASIQSNYNNYDIIHIKPKIRVLGELFNRARYSLEYSKSFSAVDFSKNYEEFNFLINVPTDNDLSFELELSKVFQEKSFQFGFSYFF